MAALLAAVLLASAGAAAQYEQRPRVRVYYLPPATHFVQDAQWREYKRRHDEQVERDVEEAKRLNAMVSPPTPVYVQPAPARLPPPPAGPPGVAEIREFKDTFVETVSAFLADKSRPTKGVFLLKDDAAGEVLRLKLQHVHADALRYHSATEVSSCLDFVTADEPKRTVDLDFELTEGEGGDWSVSRIFVHDVNGRPRFAYDAGHRRRLIRASAGPGPAPRPTAPANLAADIRPADPSDASLDGRGGLSVSVSNAGPGAAYAVRLRLDVHSAPPGVSLPAEVVFGDIRPGGSAAKVVPISVDEDSRGGTVRAQAAVTEANGFDTEPILLDFEAAPPRRAALEAAGASVEDGAVKPGRTARLSVSLRNAGRAPAVGARASLRLGSSDLFMSGEPSVAMGDIAPGESREAVFEFFVNRRVLPGAELPIFLSAADASGRNGFSDRLLPVKMGQSAGPLRELSLKGPGVVSGETGVDRPPAARTPRDPRAFAVVIGIEKYRDVAGVEYASRDAQAVHAYLTESMGFAPENVVLLKDERAGRSDLSTYLGPWLADRAAGDKSRVFVYYSGHGTVDAKTGETYLVPYDGDPSYPDTKGYALKDLYASLGRLGGAQAVVALDSCFSGAGGRSVLPPGTRPLVPVKGAAVPENVVVLAAAGGDQISASFPSARHGLMTYFLLRGLGGEADADRDGRITTLELYRYLAPAVEFEARRQHVEQRPRLEPPPESIGERGGRVWLERLQ